MKYNEQQESSVSSYDIQAEVRPLRYNIAVDRNSDMISMLERESLVCANDPNLGFVSLITRHGTEDVKNSLHIKNVRVLWFTVRSFLVWSSSISIQSLHSHDSIDSTVCLQSVTEGGCRHSRSRRHFISSSGG